jgi:hypothetical protein
MRDTPKDHSNDRKRPEKWKEILILLITLMPKKQQEPGGHMQAS